MVFVTFNEAGAIATITKEATEGIGGIWLDDSFDGKIGEPWSLFHLDGRRKTIQDVLEFRKRAYQEEADPIYFDVVRGKATIEEWNAKIEEIKARYPKDDLTKLPY